ncbi:MAG: ABC transporter ATP-binding protein [Planctomycetota bacterium]|nr:ABC transporter ATP-binding protein [Planctomycetota bacterium]
MIASFLELNGVEKRFGRTRALAGVDLDVLPGELLVILGPTGAGKTTILRTIAGLETPDAGTVRMGGEDVTARTPAERDVALVFQNFSLYPGWTVRQNLAFPLRAPGRGLTPEAIDERVSWAADLLHIHPLLDRDSRHLSGGEMQRVALGRAIVRRPRLFLMDEPLSNLDAKLRETLRVELVQIARELETPMVYVTHDQAEALSMADRIAVLSEGKVQQIGKPRNVYLRPASPTVARQLGQPPMNVFEAHTNGHHWFARDGTPLVEAVEEPQGDGLLGVRPEHVEPFGGDTPGEVLVVEDTGPTRILLVRWAGTKIHVLARRDLEIRPGDEVSPRIEPERAVIWRS